MKKLELLIPQYRENEEVIKPLLDSLVVQQNVNFGDIGVIIVNDGSDIKLSEEFLKAYPFEIKYLQAEHNGVSATRQYALDNATAEYVMFCDCDDMFFNACGLWIIFREMRNNFDALVSVFVEETRVPDTKEIAYINREQDSTFVHGKIYRRQYLIDNNIRWNKALTIHEDSYFNCLAMKLTEKCLYCMSPFYLWKWRDESVCRHDPKYILKTFNNMLDSNTALVKEFISRGKEEIAQFYATSMIYDSYLQLNKKEWIEQENQEYRNAVEKRFKKYYNEFKSLFDTTSEDVKNQIFMGQRNRYFQEGMIFEEITFKDWIKQIEKIGD